MPHDVDFIACEMGGGWFVVPAGKDDVHFIVESIIGMPDAPIEALGGEIGWIVQPADLKDLAKEISAHGLWIEERGE